MWRWKHFSFLSVFFYVIKVTDINCCCSRWELMLHLLFQFHQHDRLMETVLQLYFFISKTSSFLLRGQRCLKRFLSAGVGGDTQQFQKDGFHWRSHWIPVQIQSKWTGFDSETFGHGDLVLLIDDLELFVLVVDDATASCGSDRTWRTHSEEPITTLSFLCHHSRKHFVDLHKCSGRSNGITFFSSSKIWEYCVTRCTQTLETRRIKIQSTQKITSNWKSNHPSHDHHVKR